MKKVICTDAECTNLTYKKEYDVLNKWKQKSKMKPYETYDVYLVVDDTGNESVEPSCLFEEVEETKAYNFRELITNIKPKEQYECEGFKIKCCEDGTIEIYNTSTGTRIGFYKYDTFAKIESKPVTLEEVIISDKKCKIEHWRITDLINDEDDGINFLWLQEYQNLDEIIHTIGEEFNTTACKEILKDAKWYLED